MAKVICEGLATCTREPRCDYGLEGFNEGDTYRFQLMEREEPGREGQRYLRLWHPALGDEGRDVVSYECCRPEALRKYFSVKGADITWPIGVSEPERAG